MYKFCHKASLVFIVMSTGNVVVLKLLCKCVCLQNLKSSQKNISYAANGGKVKLSEKQKRLIQNFVVMNDQEARRLLLRVISDQPRTIDRRAFRQCYSGACFYKPRELLVGLVSHCLPYLSTCFRSICFNVLLKRSTRPLPLGWYAVVLSLAVPKRAQTSLEKRQEVRTSVRQ